jgi:hypothetical protein
VHLRFINKQKACNHHNVITVKNNRMMGMVMSSD